MRKKYTTKEFIEKEQIVHGDIYNYSLVEYFDSISKMGIICNKHGIFREDGNRYDYLLVRYINNTSKIDIICQEHGVFEQIVNNHLDDAGCPSCKNFKGEKAIKKYLESENIRYISQHSFDGCKNKCNIYFDFFLPNYKLLIDYDGEQHYKSIKHYGGDTGFKKRQEYDKLKNIFVKNNNINLLRIKFNEFNNIDKILINNIK